MIEYADEHLTSGRADFRSELDLRITCLTPSSVYPNGPAV